MDTKNHVFRYVCIHILVLNTMITRKRGKTSPELSWKEQLTPKTNQHETYSGYRVCYLIIRSVSLTSIPYNTTTASSKPR